MNGIDIVRHGIDMLLRNLGPALRISLGPVLLAAVATGLLAALGLGMAVNGPGLGQVAGGFGAFLGMLVATVVWLFVLSWVAVAWHRYVLLEERSDLLPPIRAELIWPYLGRTILLALILVLLSIPMGLLLVPVVTLLPPIAALFVASVATWLLLGWITMRLSLVLPARAVERPMTFGESWSATAPASGAILVVVLVLAVINVLLSMAFGAALGTGLVATVLRFVVQWFTTMLGLSVLTTLYGHLVERRALAA